MMPSNWRKGMTAAAGGLLLVSQVPADGTGQAQVDSVRLIGDLVQVLVSVPGGGPASGKVVIFVAVDGRSTPVEVPFISSEGQKVFVEWSSPVKLDEVPPVGIILDDGPPF